MKNLKNLKVNNKGSALLLFCFVLVFLAILSATIMVSSMNEKHFTDHTGIETQLLYYVEGALSDAIFHLADNVLNFDPNPQTIDDENADEDGFVQCTSWSTESLNLNSKYKIVYANSDNKGNPITYIRLNEDGTISTVIDYLITAEAKHPVHNDMIRTIVQRVGLKQTPVFQWAIFSNWDIDMHPGPFDYTFFGRMHSNRDIYLDSDGNGATNWLASQSITAAGEIYNFDIGTGGEAGPGTTEILVRDQDPFDEFGNIIEESFMAMELVEEGEEGAPGEEGIDHNYIDPITGENIWEETAIARWNGTVQDSAHGITSIGLPVDSDSLAPGGLYADNAGLRIETVGGALTVTYIDTNTDTTYTFIRGTESWSNEFDQIITEAYFTNMREELDDGNGEVTVTEIDMEKLQTQPVPPCQDCPPSLILFPSNGLIYVNRAESDTVNPNGFRLRNGYNLNIKNNPNHPGLTVASPNPGYVLGDYNTGRDENGVNHIENRVPAAIMADSISPLSNAWLDSNSNLPLGQRKASNTISYYASLEGYIYLEDDYPFNGKSGGNLLEDWEHAYGPNDPATYIHFGSSVRAFETQISTAEWRIRDVYSSPAGEGGYDTNFDNPDLLPPFTPFALQIDILSWQET